jgi:hypothetical protein
MLFKRVKVGTASPATPDANCSKTITMCKACNVRSNVPQFGFIIMWVKVHDILGYFCILKGGEPGSTVFAYLKG